MKLFFMNLFLCNSFLFVFLSNPVSMGLMLIFQCLTISLLICNILISSWLSFLIFLMMVGGLLILLMYMGTISSNEMFNFNKNLLFLYFFMFIFFDIMMISDYSFDSMDFDLSYMDLIFMLKLYNLKSLFLTIVLVIYLFFTMISVSSIVKLFKGPMRSN